MEMKSFLCGMLGLLFLFPFGANAEDILMPQEGKQVVLVQPGQTINYYDYKGYFNGNAIDGADWQFEAFATTIFKPAREGDKIRIDFETVKLLTGDGDACLKIYNGIFDTTSVTYNKYGYQDFPTTSNMLENLSDGTFTNKTYTSTDATGALSCCVRGYDSEYDKTMGWKATVIAVGNDVMKVESAEADYTDVRSELYVGEQNITMGSIIVKTGGASDADALKSISFTLNGKMFDATQLRLCTKKGNVFTPVETGITKNGDTYTFTCNQPFETGTNTFCIIGDILPATAIGTTSVLTITGLATNKSFNTLTTATPRQQTVTEARMVNGSHIYVYVTDDMPFYDDGGVDGKISLGFEGYVTFLPMSDDKKIQIDMHDIHIFYNKSVASFGRADVLAFYNGITAAKDSLLYTMNVDGGRLDNYNLKSTAENGALTLYLKSTHQTEINRGDGFEAVVSEFSAAQMEIISSDVTKLNGNISGCTENAQIMQFCLTAKNTEPALQPVLFLFNANDTYTRIDSATLYYTGASPVFATTCRVGRVAVENNTFSIPAGNLSLTEGENHFFLAGDVVCNVQNGQTVAADIVQVNFGNNTEYKDFTNPGGALTVNNTLCSDCGRQTVHVYDDWVFTHTPDDTYTDRYKAETCNQTTVFIPATADNIIQLDFSDFAVSYNSYSKADFRIYEGQGTSGNLLWEVNAENKEVGPGIVRSGAGDGSLTVVFNANTDYGTFVGANKGWHAIVSQYRHRPMRVQNVELQVSSSESLVRKQQQAELLQLGLTTEGDLLPLGFKTVKVTLGDCVSSVDTILLLQNGKTVAKEKVNGTEITLSPLVVLNEYENNFTLAVNVAEDAVLGTEVSIQDVQIIVGETAFSPEVPANGRIIRNMYILQSGTQRVEVDDTPLSFYDDGGPEGKITLGIRGTVTFVPAVENCAVQLKFKQWNLNGADKFYVYYADAPKESADVSLSYYTKDIDKLVLVSTAASGALTVYYESSNILASDGWEIEVTCHSLSSLVLDSVVVTDVSPAAVTRGSADVPMLCAVLHVSGNRGKMPVENFNLQTSLGNGSFKIYRTGTQNVFSRTGLLTTADTVTDRGTYYYWITLTVPASVAEGSNIAATLETVEVNHIACKPESEVTASVGVVSGMHGTFRIGAGDKADFRTIQAAVDALKNGVDGPVTFLVEPGTYTEHVIISEINGASETNSVTFRSLTGNREDVVIRHDEYSPVSTPDGDETQGVFTLDGADYVTLCNLSFTTGHSSYHAVLLVQNVSEHVTVDSCCIYRATESSAINARLVYAYASGSKANNNNNYFTLSNSILRGGYIGVALVGNANVEYSRQIGGRIIKNTLEGQGNIGIYLSGGECGALVDGNTVRNTVTTKSGSKSIDVVLGEGSCLGNNCVYTNLDVHAVGIYLRAVNGTPQAPVYIFNNVVDMHSTSTSSSYAMDLTRTTDFVALANNTIRTSGSAVYPLYIAAKQNNMQVLNNIFQSEETACAVRIHAADDVSTSRFEHNVLFSDGTGIAFIDGDISDMEAWKTAVNSTSDHTEKVVFVDADLLRPKEKGNLIAAEPLDFVTTDITGRLRAEIPTIGAYEYIESTALEQSAEKNSGIQVFPTVTRGLLNVSGASGAVVRILSLQGQEMFRTTVTMDAAALSVHALPQGIYLLCVNGNVFRFIKQ